MATVLLGWELGAGLGHVSRLLEVAKGLAACGHSPVLALKDLAVTRPVLRDSPFRVVQAPLWLGAVPRTFKASTYADILAVRGYADADGLGLLVRAWQSLIELTGARLVIGDHAPTLCLAASGIVPTILVGNGFTVPPMEGATFPRVGPGEGPPASAESLLEVVRKVQSRRGLPVPETLPAMLTGSARFVLTINELDPYRLKRRLEIIGPLRPPLKPLPHVDGSSFFAYLSGDYPGMARILPGLAQAGFRGAAYIRDGTPAAVEAARQAGLTIYNDPPPLGEVLAKAAAIVHHAGISTTETAVAVGRPQVVLPAHLEQGLTGMALKRLGVGRNLSGQMDVAAVVEALREVVNDGGYRTRALEFARTIESRQYPGCLPGIIGRCVELIE